MKKPKCSVLLVDSSGLLERSIPRLRTEGCEVHNATSGTDGIHSLMKHKPPKVILVNEILMDMTGLEFLERLIIARPGALQHSSIVFLCKSRCPVDERIDGFVHPSTNIDEILQVIQDLAGFETAEFNSLRPDCTPDEGKYTAPKNSGAVQ